MDTPRPPISDIVIVTIPINDHGELLNDRMVFKLLTKRGVILAVVVLTCVALYCHSLLGKVKVGNYSCLHLHVVKSPHTLALSLLVFSRTYCSSMNFMLINSSFLYIRNLEILHYALCRKQKYLFERRNEELIGLLLR